MRILVTAASKHGATSEIATAIAATLRAGGSDGDVAGPETVASVEPYDAVVLGSGVYAGRWLGTAKQFAERHAAALRSRPVYLFSSGPTGDPLKPDELPLDAAPLSQATGAREHHLFAGRLDSARVGLAERALIRVVHAEYGDFRPWPEIEAWARRIGRGLAGTTGAW